MADTVSAGEKWLWRPHRPRRQPTRRGQKAQENEGDNGIRWANSPRMLRQGLAYEA